MQKVFSTLLCLVLGVVCGTLTCGAQSYKLAPMNPGNVFVSPDYETVDVPIKVTNYGNDEITSFGYTLYYQTEGVSEPEVTYTLDTPLGSWETTTVNIPIRPAAEPGQSDVVFNIPTVNGTYNGTSVTYTYITRCTVRTMPVKRVVVEEWTGMWCQYCTKGLAIMELLHRMYGDRFIGIGVHDGDRLATLAYDGMKSTYGMSFPSLWVNRKGKTVDVVDQSVFANELEVMSMLNIDVKAEWDAERNNIQATATVEAVAATEGSYALAYVLTADSLQNDAFTQKNNYDWYGMDNLPPEADPYKSGEDITGLAYNHVAVASQGVQSGIDGSLPSSFEAEQVVTHSATFENIAQYSIVGSYSKVNDRSNLNVVALILDTSTGYIVNAAQCRITDNTATDIHTANTIYQVKTPSIYDLNGRRLKAITSPGVYIVNGQKVVR